ncbi:hypothetical protein [Streptomyces sp. NPDC006368]|uniref:hypothetical protein n=1 Tax=Streptomyces sp. NPDC006368 TaxID=3156760 RepID=UPI0033BD4E4E
MTTLHIEHEITDFETWKAAFDRFGEFRKQGGVRHYRIQRPLGDARHVVLDVDAAKRFEEALRTRAWSSTKNAPALVGTPSTMILDTVEDEMITG